MRGDTWYLVEGNYSGKTFSTAASGTTRIIIKKATPADHGGISANWVDTISDGQCVFSGTVSFTTSYWVFDGVTGAFPSKTSSDYGFYFPSTAFVIILAGAHTFTDVTCSHISATSVTADTPRYAFGTDGATLSTTAITFSHNLINGFQVAFFVSGPTGSHGGWLMEYNVILNAVSTANNHGSGLDCNYGMQNPVYRYNIMQGYSGGGCQTCAIEANNGDMTGAEIYGNVFEGLSNCNECIGGTSAGQFSNAKVYNNTFYQNTGGGSYMVPWVGAGSKGGSGNVAYNNLIVSQQGTVGGGVTHDYNAFYSASSIPSEAHGQTASGNPLVSPSTLDYNLTANTSPGISLPSPYNIDPNGKVRATWTRGAYEFGTAITNAMISVTPTSLNFGSVVTNTTSDLTITVKNIGASTLSGAVSIAAPFTVFSGGTYSLSANQSQTVTIRFAPTSVTSYSQNVTFTGGGGATTTISAAGILASANTPPTVSAIAQNATDVDPNTAGIQVYEGTVAQLSGSASDANGNALTWQWIYTINGGAEVIYQSGAGTVNPASFSYGASTAGKTFLWKLRVSDGVATTESQLSIGISAPPVVGAGISFEAESGTITAPFSSAGGMISQATTTDLAGGGRATYTFSVTNAGEYAIQAYVNAPGLTENSFFLNIDGEPQDSTMAWDILPPTVGSENRLVSWRGNGTAEANELVPKFFSLSQGTHQLIIIGREANVQLDRFVIFKRPSAPGNLRSLANAGQ